MMRTFKIILITLFVTLSFASCTKDEEGQGIQYYKNKIGVGYVFYKWDNDSVAPIPNLKMRIESCTRGSGMLFPGNSHFDYVYTNDDGKYEFKLAKKIDGKNVVSMTIDVVEYPISNNPIFSTGYITIFYETIDNNENILNIRTFYVYPDKD